MGRLESHAVDRLPLVSVSRAVHMLRLAIWLVPVICVAGSVALATGLLVVDGKVRLSRNVLFLFPGSPEGAHSFLSAIVQAMISFTGVVFSITIVVLQLSSAQFSPRVLRNFLRDRTIQYALGVFVATFVYAMVVLRAVKGGTGTGQANFVPRLAVTGAFALVLVSVGLFIAYIAHVTNVIRVATIISRIGADTRAVLSRRDVGGPAGGNGAALPHCRTIACPQPGVVVSVNSGRLVSLAAERGCLLRLTVRIGDYLPEGVDLFEVRGAPGASAWSRKEHGEQDRRRRQWLAAVYKCVILDTERTMEQDVAFGFRQLVDIALQALSPSVNAPTTAAQVIDEMHDLLRRLVTEPQPGGGYRDDDGELRLIVPQYRVYDYLQLAVEEIWHYGRGSPQVPGRLRQMLNDLHEAARQEHRPAIKAWQTRLRDTDTAA